MQEVKEATNKTDRKNFFKDLRKKEAEKIKGEVFIPKHTEESKVLSRAIDGAIDQEPVIGALIMMCNRELIDENHKLYNELTTMAVGMKSGELTLYASKEFIRRNTLDKLISVCLHEAYHVLFRHLTSNSHSMAIYSNQEIINIGMDLEINSHVCNLPNGCYSPGRKQEIIKHDVDGEALVGPDGKFVMIESPLSEWTQKLEPALGSDAYIRLLLELMKKDKNVEEYISQLGAQGAGLHGSEVGNHSYWNDGEPEEGESQEEYRERIRREAESFNNVVDATLKEAAMRAQRNNSWGNTSESIKKKIMDLFDYTIPWQTAVRRFLGHSVPASYRTTYNRINRRMPGILPGRTVSYKPYFHIYIDQSGSVGDEMLRRFFSELNGLARNETFMIYYFDTQVKPGREWRKGSPCPLDRELCGGTCFNAPTMHALDSKCDGFFILTDGFASRPIDVPRASRKRRAWIIGEGCPIPDWMSNFSQDMVITLDNKSCKMEQE